MCVKKETQNEESKMLLFPRAKLQTLKKRFSTTGLRQLRTNIANLESLRTQTHQLLKAKKKTLAENKITLSQRSAQLKALNNSIHEKNVKRYELQTSLDRLNRQNKSSEQSGISQQFVKKYETEINTLNEAIRASDSEIENVEDEIKQLTNQNANLGNEISKLKNGLTKLESQHHKTLSFVRDLSRTLAPVTTNKDEDRKTRMPDLGVTNNEIRFATKTRSIFGFFKSFIFTTEAYEARKVFARSVEEKTKRYDDLYKAAERYTNKIGELQNLSKGYKNLLGANIAPRSNANKRKDPIDIILSNLSKSMRRR